MQKLFYVLIVWLVSVGVFGQRNQIMIGKSAIEVSAGPSTLFWGDIGDAILDDYFSDLTPFHLNATFSVGFHQTIAERFAYKIAIHGGTYGRGEKRKMLKYEADVFELTGRLEYQLFSANYPKTESLYLFAGVGVLRSSFKEGPITGFDTFGDTISAVIPMGLGYKRELIKRFSVGAEFDFHYTLMDMLEGRGVPTTSGIPQDILSSISLVMSYQISDGRLLMKGNRRLKNCNCDNW